MTSQPALPANLSVLYPALPRFHRLPAQPTSCLGHASEVAELRTRLCDSEVRLLTLTVQVKVRRTAWALQAFVVTTKGNDSAPVAASANLLQATWGLDRSGAEAITVWVTVGAVAPDQQQRESAFTSATNQTVQTTLVAAATTGRAGVDTDARSEHQRGGLRGTAAGGRGRGAAHQ